MNHSSVVAAEKLKLNLLRKLKSKRRINLRAHPTILNEIEFCPLELASLSSPVDTLKPSARPLNRKFPWFDFPLESFKFNLSPRDLLWANKRIFRTELKNEYKKNCASRRGGKCLKSSFIFLGDYHSDVFKRSFEKLNLINK